VIPSLCNIFLIFCISLVILLKRKAMTKGKKWPCDEKTWQKRWEISTGFPLRQGSRLPKQMGALVITDFMTQNMSNLNRAAPQTKSDSGSLWLVFNYSYTHPHKESNLANMIMGSNTDHYTLELSHNYIRVRN
jgi:hypothetical protein